MDMTIVPANPPGPKHELGHKPSLVSHHMIGSAPAKLGTAIDESGLIGIERNEWFEQSFCEQERPPNAGTLWYGQPMLRRREQYLRFQLVGYGKCIARLWKGRERSLSRGV